MMHDLGTVRIFQGNETVEFHFGRGDVQTRSTVKACGGRFDGARKVWSVKAQKGKEAAVVERVRRLVAQNAPEAWRKALAQGIGKIVATTNKYDIKIAEAGVRLAVPRGDVHEWTLKNEVEGAEEDRGAWLIPAECAAGAKAKKVIQDSIVNDQNAFRAAVDYLEGFSLTGLLDLAGGEAEEIGITPGAVVAADPSFVRAADKSVPKELNKFYPMKVLRVSTQGDFLEVKFAFFTGGPAYKWMRDRLSLPEAERPPVLDVRHVKDRWVRRRG